MSTPYPPPVARFLELGGKDVTGRWMDYLELGVGPEHVPDLVRMATDEQLNEADDEGPEMWAPMHAWRALGQLRAESAVEPLLELAGKLEDELFTEPDLALVFGMVGRAAIPPLARVLADDSQRQGLHVLAVRGLEEIAMGDESTRDEVVPLLVARMEKWERNSDDVNAFLVDSLAEMGVVEAAPLMEQAFAADRVDLLLRGDWEDVQMDLGLIEERREQSGGPRAPRSAMSEPFGEGGWVPPPAPPRTRDRAKKNKRKQQKESRKKNRRRK
ncbi:MAG: PBS lyase [Longimicrobiaceae bacterium]